MVRLRRNTLSTDPTLATLTTFTSNNAPNPRAWSSYRWRMLGPSRWKTTISTVTFLAILGLVNWILLTARGQVRRISQVFLLYITDAILKELPPKD